MTACSDWVKSWFKKADNDIINAQVVIEAAKGAYDTVCFHCQQCVEKYLKGFLIAHEQEVEKTHDLVRLLRRCVAIDPSFIRLENACLILTQYAIEMRYPDDFSEYTRDEAVQALDYATQIKDLTAKSLFRAILSNLPCMISSGWRHRFHGFGLFAGRSSKSSSLASCRPFLREGTNHHFLRNI